MVKKGRYFYNIFPIRIVCLLTKGLLMGVGNPSDLFGIARKILDFGVSPRPELGPKAQSNDKPE
jgi:hypothetical protein